MRGQSRRGALGDVGTTGMYPKPALTDTGAVQSGDTAVGDSTSTRCSSWSVIHRLLPGLGTSRR